MAKESQRKQKLFRLLKDTVLMDFLKNENDNNAAVSDYILSEYQLSDSINTDNISDEDLNILVAKLEELILKTYNLNGNINEKKTTSITSLKQNFLNAFELFKNAKNDYLLVTNQLMNLLSEINEFEEKYIGHLKEKSLAIQDNHTILEKKLEFLKMQSFLKFYSEGNSYKAHLKLREILLEKLKDLELENNKLSYLDTKYSELINNEGYCDLLEAYKLLLKQEKKLDYMV